MWIDGSVRLGQASSLKGLLSGGMKLIEAQTRHRPGRKHVPCDLLQSQVTHRLVLDGDAGDLGAAGVDGVVIGRLIAVPSRAHRTDRNRCGEVCGEDDQRHQGSCRDAHRFRLDRWPRDHEQGHCEAGERVTERQYRGDRQHDGRDRASERRRPDGRMEQHERRRHREHTRQHGFRSGERAQAQGVAEVGERHDSSDGNQAGARDRLHGDGDDAEGRQEAAAEREPRGDGPRESLTHGKRDHDVDINEVQLAHQLDAAGTEVGRREHRGQTAGDVGDDRDVEHGQPGNDPRARAGQNGDRRGDKCRVRRASVERQLRPIDGNRREKNQQARAGGRAHAQRPNRTSAAWRYFAAVRCPDGTQCPSCAK